jgi:ADP-L-glycero-D-manno-heptose 6-epimerase
MIIISGGAGFIGSVLLKELQQVTNKKIIGVDRWGKSSKWMNIRKRTQIEPWNVLEFYKKLEEGYFNGLVSEIFHLGACSATSEEDMSYLIDNNFHSSRKLFQYAVKEKIPIYYASSAATYGSGEFGYKDNHEIIARLKPLNRYGLSTHLFDSWVLHQKERPLYWFGYKFFNVFGPNEYHKDKMTSVVFNAFHQIKETKRVKLFKSHVEDVSDGCQKRDFVYVKDVVRVMLSIRELVESKKISSNHSGIYNIGTGQARTFLDLVHCVYKSLNLNPQVDWIDIPKEIRPGYQYFTESSNDKINQLLPSMKYSSLEESIADYVKTYLSASDPYF